MRIKTIFLVIIFINNIHSQNLRGFAGFDFSLNKQFEKSGFVNINAGLEYKIINFIKPEIQFGVILGSIEDRVNYDVQRNS